MELDIIDVESAKERFMGNFDMYAKFLYQFPDKSLFGDLKEAIAKGDAKKAFEAVHTMKGVAANLSLKLLEQPIHTVVEALRGNELPSSADWDALEQAYQQTIAAIKNAQTEGKRFF